METQGQSNEQRKWGPLPKNPYEALGISKNATKDEIRTAFKIMSRKHHPDLNPDNKEEATQWMEILVEAKSLLLDSTFKPTYFRGWNPFSDSTYRPRDRSRESSRQKTEQEKREEEERERRRAERARQDAEYRAQQEERRRARDVAEEAERVRRETEERYRQANEEQARQEEQNRREY